MTRALLVAIALLAVGACATVNNRCREDLSNCMARCQAADPETGPSRSSNPPQSTLTDCEKQCGQCRGPSSTQKPIGKPTPVS